MEDDPDDCISRLKTLAESDELPEAFNVRVLGIYRYIIDKSFPIVDPDFTDAFDIVITDGRFKTKCLLSPALNFLVYEHKLRKDCFVSVTECNCLIDEESLEQVPCVILQRIEILNSAPTNTEDQDPAEEIEFCENATAKEKQELPLAASRGYYLPLWNDEDYFGIKWLSDPDLKLRNPISNAITIADLDSFWKALPRPFPALIGRIVSKTRIKHYGKSTDEKRRYPFQAYFELEDRTGTVSVCIWDFCCVLLYNYLQVGDTVAILNYRVSRKFAPRSNAVYNTSDAVKIEISVNPSNPVAEVYKIAPEELGPDWKLPDVPYRFIDRKSLASFSSGLIFDVVGTVMFVSRESRERKGNSSSFWTSKWVHLKDETSSTPIILQLYASSQPETFDSIAAGNILVAARVLLKIEPQDSKHRKFCFLTTTRETQLYILKKPSDVINKPFAGLSAISDAIKWRQSAEAKQLLRGSCSSGCYDFPPLPQSLESYKRTFSNENPMDLITTVNLGFVLRDLHYRERVRLHIQGIIAALEFVPAASSEASADLTSGEATSSQLSETPSNDERGKDSSSACSASQTTDKSSMPSSSRESRSPSVDSAESDRGARIAKKPRRMRTRSPKKINESESDSDDESTASSIEIRTSAVKHLGRVLPERKCKKVCPRIPRHVRVKTRSKREANARNASRGRKRKGKKLRGDLPKKAKRTTGTPKSKTKIDVSAGKKNKKGKISHRSVKTDQQVSQTTDSKRRSSIDSSKPAKYFPFRILDETWPNLPTDTPLLGLSKPSSHANTFPKLCSRDLTNVRVVPSADRQGFASSDGYWRLMLVGLNRRTIINAIFMPETPKKSGEEHEEPEQGVFLSALGTGKFPRWYPVEALLNRANEELKGRRMVFVLDVYSHGEDKVEVVINRAF